MPRLRRADPAKPGWTRRRCGRGFVFLDQHGQRVDASGPNAVGTWSSPAWAEVWICPWPNGHIQAVGTDEAGRRQYLYHPDWRAARSRSSTHRGIRAESSRCPHPGRRAPATAGDALRTGWPPASVCWTSVGFGWARKTMPRTTAVRAGHVALRPCEYPRRHGPVAVHRKIRQRTRCRPR